MNIKNKGVIADRLAAQMRAEMPTLRKRIIRLLVGRPLPFTGAEEITTVRNAFLWRLAILPGLDAYIIDGKVTLFRTREQ